MNAKVSLSTAALVVGLAGAAAAADLPNIKAPYEAPTLAKEFSWAGVYVGAHAGYGWGQDTTKEYLTFPWFYVGLSHPFKPAGFLAGGHAGINWQFGSIVLGAEADVDFTTNNGGFNDPPAAPLNPGGRGFTRLQTEGSLRARFGYSFDRFMIYGTAGYALGQLPTKYQTWAPIVTEWFKTTLNGYTFGGGIEYAYTDNILFRLEYRRTNFNTIRFDSNVAFPGFSGTQSPRYDEVRVGASYKF